MDYLDLAAAVLSPPGAFPVITPASVFIPAGEASTIIDVYPYFDDALVEGPETVHLILTNPPGVTYSIGIGEAEVVILDNEMADPPSANTIVSLLATQPATAEAAGGVLPAAFRAFRTGPTGAPLAVNYTLSGSAINGTDYTALPGSVVIPAGLDSAPFFASAIDDALVEGGETVVATLSPSPAYSPGASTTGTVTITDNDPNVNVEATDALASETGGNTGTFRFWRTGPTTTPLAIGIVVTGTANSGSDYAGIGTLAILPPGVSSTNLTVIPSDDSAPEGTESVVVTITAVNDPAYALGRTTATVSITDNDVPLPTPPSVSVTATDASAAEAGLNPAVFTITRTGATNIPLTVNYTLGGGAGNGTDYNLLPLTVQIPVGANSVTRTITPIDDPTFEGTESVVLTLTASPNHTLGTASATANIADNDASLANAVLLDGVNDHISVPDSPSVRITGTITVEAWINRAATGVQHSVVEKYGCSGLGGYVLRVTDANRLMFGTRDDCNIGSSVIGAASIPANTWTHVAGTWDGAALRVYVNGVLDGTLATTRNPKAGTTPLLIGARGNNAGTTFNGRIDEVRLWNVARSGAQILANRNICVPPASAGLAGYWRLDEGAGLGATDATANGNNGALLNGATWSSAAAPVTCAP